MYNVIELNSLIYKPKINDISLALLKEYYETFLYPFIYHYHIKSSSIEKNIELRFDKENFCHLLGIESIAKNAIANRVLHNYRGLNGWNNIENGMINIKHLRSLNNKKFKSVKAKYVYFYLIPNLVKQSMAVKFDVNKIMNSTKIRCEILFYSKVEGDSAIIHLGIEKNENGYYFPRTFFVEKVSNKEDDIYIANQEEINVKIDKRIIML